MDKSIAVAANQTVTANFKAAFTLTGVVTGVDGNGVSGAKVTVVDTHSGAPTTVNATTNAQGQIVTSAGASSLGLVLAPGSLVVSAVGADGTQYYGVAGTGQDPDCVVSGVSCGVTLNHDRNIAFDACVVPNPDGAPLPAGTPDPIPGAKVKPPLEAVGCWTRENGTGDADATMFTSKGPIRLDGIDVRPASGTTFTLDLAGTPTVTSSGPAQLVAAGVAITPMVDLSLAYSGAAGGQLNVSDLGAGTGPLAPNLFGLPISLGTTGPLGYGLPFTESTGQTVVNFGGQFALPSDSRAVWNVLEGKFQNADGADVPSIGLQDQLTFTDRGGLVTMPCVSINDLAPFQGRFGKLNGLQGCWTPAAHPSQLSVMGMFEMPTALEHLAGDINASVTFQNIASQYTGQLQGYQVQAAQLEFDHLNSSSFGLPPGAGEDPGDVAKIRESGLPIGAGFYLQKLGGGFTNNLAAGTVSSVNLTGGMSLGPEFDFAGHQVNLFRLDFRGQAQPPQTPADSWVLRFDASGTLGRLTPYELQLGNGTLAVRLSATAPVATLLFHVGASLPLLGSIKGDIAGSSDVPHGIAFDGTVGFSNANLNGSGELLFNAPYVAPFGSVPPGTSPATLAGCLTGNSALGGSVTMGFTFDFVHPPTPGCNLSGLFRPTILPQAISSRAGANAAVSRGVAFRIGHPLRGTLLAFHGDRGAPRFTLTGPGVHVTTPAGTRPSVSRRAWVFTDVADKVTYVAVLGANAGKYVARPLRGSASITSTLESNPLASAKIRSVKVSVSGCTDKVRYRLAPAAGQRLVAYAREGSDIQAVGNLQGSRGTLTLPMVPGAKGRGSLFAYVFRGRKPVGSMPLATFTNSASNGSERLTRLKLTGTTLRWAPTCGALTYAVTVTHGASTLHSHTTASQVHLASSHRPMTVTIRAIGPGGATLAVARHTFPA